MTKFVGLTLVALLSAAISGAQAPATDMFVGTWTGEVACLHGGGDVVAISITRDSNGRLTGGSDWALAHSDGRKGPQVPFTTLTESGNSLTAGGRANDHRATLRAEVTDGIMRGSWRIDGVDDVWTFSARRAGPSGAAR